MSQKIDVNDFIKKLEKVWGKRPCPMCLKDDWNVSDTIYELREFRQGLGAINTSIIPIITITCANCGNTVLVNAIQVGYVKPDNI